VVLSRAKRDAIWPVFEEYRGQLTTRKLKEVDDAYREVAGLLSAADSADNGYSAVVVDETQDLGPQALKLLRALVPAGANDLFFVGDGHQRIYSRHRASMSRCGMDIRGRSRKLYLNYRTTDEIRRAALALLEGVEIDDLDDGLDDSRRYKSLCHGPAPLTLAARGLEGAAKECIQFIHEFTASRAGQASPTICVVAHGERSRDGLAQQLQAAGLACVTISSQANHTDRSGVVHLATMHRTKGLEFDAVVVVAPKGFLADDNDAPNHRRLLYVALTRAKVGALVLMLE
jgi:superfamily I DNA/RNA helicase